jgi:hypothetical protein
VLSGSLDHQALLGHRAHKAYKVLKAQSDLLGRLVQQDSLVAKADKVYKVL